MHKLIPFTFLSLLLSGCPTEAPKPVAAPPAVVPATSPTVAAPAPPPAAAAPTSGTPMKVADVFAQKDTLGTTPVQLQGKVVKFNANIMGSNWIHIQDGSGAPGSDDVVVTTKSVVAVGDQVEVVGVVSRSRDFGAGYKFDVILENANVTKK